MKRATTAALLVWLSTVGASAQEVKQYSVPDLGMSFAYPKHWGMVWNKKLEMTTFTIPVGDSGATAKAEVFASATRDSIEVWQEVQVRVNGAMQREIERQWQEEVLGVPMLYTKLRYVVGSEPTTTLIGLLYASSPRKFHFRLTAPSSAFDQAEADWRNVLVTLRTASGALPSPEDPTQAPKIDPFKKPEKVVPPPPTVVLKPKPEAPLGTQRGEISLSAKAGATEVKVWIPKGWVANWSDGVWKLTRPDFSGAVVLEPASMLDSVKPESALSKASAKRLDMFTVVELREEPKPRANGAGAILAWVERRGKSGEGFLATLDAVGRAGDYYWRAAFECRDAERYRRERGEVMKLLDKITIEPAQ
ncbi:MAG: hypothetical protein HONBIEJF_00655 [Fimbriimonadaceae bacterium]|nr:hypothetical protein [Fimbriimonadaceae bacterium]